MAQRNQPPVGILSHVFSFVSREVETFINNATGGTTSTHPGNVRRVKSPKRIGSTRRKTKDVSKGERGDVVEISAEEYARLVGRASSNSPIPHRRHKSRKQQESNFSEQPERSSVEELSGPEACSPSPTRFPQAPFTMPGSLFPRSPSMQPGQANDEAEQHIRFTFQTNSTERGVSSCISSATPKKALNPGVKAVVDKFRVGEDDSGPSTLLPNISPSSSRHSRKSLDDITRISASSKIKARSLDTFSDADTSGEIRVRGKEKELIAAKEEQRQNERRREQSVAHDDAALSLYNRDKERIRTLEEEIKRLKEELARRPYRGASVVPQFAPPPPPPPPPPPLPTLARCLLSAPTASGSSSFSGARSALRSAPKPVEAPINLPPSRRHGVATVGVPADRMAAFLTEMKTVRLKKVSGIASTASSSLSSGRRLSINDGERSFSLNNTSGDLSRRIQSLYSSANSSLPHIPPRDIPSIGEKRKRYDSTTTADDDDPIPKKRSVTSETIIRRSTSSQIHLPPSISTPSLASDNDADHTSPEETIPSTPPTQSTQNAEPEINSSEYIDVDMDYQLSSQKASTHSIRPGTPYKERVLSKVLDSRVPVSPLPVDASPRRPKPPSRIPRAMAPPPPPARVPRYTPELDTTDDKDDKEEDSNDDELSLKPPSDPPEPVAPPKRLTSRRGRRSSASSHASSSRPRKTLDYELRQADKQSMMTEANGEEDVDLDSGVLVGVGTKSKKRGFLAHGGAGGPPVMMGVGYVIGAEESDADDADDDDEYVPRPTASKRRSGSPAKRKGRR